MHACIQAHMNTQTHTHTHAHKCTLACASTPLHVHTHMHTCIYIHKNMLTGIYTCTHRHTYTNTGTHRHTIAYAHKQVHCQFFNRDYLVMLSVAFTTRCCFLLYLCTIGEKLPITSKEEVSENIPICIQWVETCKKSNVLVFHMYVPCVLWDG